MTESISNNPPILVELTPELADFVLDNCEANIEFGLKAMGTMESRDLIEKLIENMEKFKALRVAVKAAR